MTYKFFVFTAFIILSMLVFNGCVHKNTSMYYWGDYSKSYYNYKKNPGEESMLNHKKVLEDIVEQSKAQNLRVPPGVCAELGYIYFKQSDEKLAFQYFQMEEDVYPESKVLMSRFKQAIKTKTGKIDEKSKAVPIAEEINKNNNQTQE